MTTLEEAIAKLRADLARVHQLTLERDAAARRGTVVRGDIAELNQAIAEARAALAVSRAEAAAILNAPAPAPEPAPEG